MNAILRFHGRCELKAAHCHSALIYMNKMSSSCKAQLARNSVHSRFFFIFWTFWSSIPRIMIGYGKHDSHSRFPGVFRVANVSLQVMRFLWHLCIPGSSLNRDRQQESRVRFSSTSDLFSQIALELHIPTAVFINLGWTKNLDHRPQTLCHPSGSSCQSVQPSYSVCFSRGFGGQREDQPAVCFSTAGHIQLAFLLTCTLSRVKRANARDDRFQ